MGTAPATPATSGATNRWTARRRPLMKEGGYVMLTDHLVTPGASLANYKYYLDRVRALRF